MAYPVAKVEIAFTDGPYVISPTWTDVTSYVRDGTTSRGRPNELSNFEAGTAVLTLDNRDRRFDPFHTTGPYYGNLLPRRQIRITATIPGDATVYGVFRGFIGGWPVTITDAGYDSTVTISAYDALGLLAEEELPDDLADNYIRTLTPLHYWPLDDPVDPLNLASTTFKDFGSAPTYLNPASGSRVGNSNGLATGISNTSLVAPQDNFITGTTTRATAGTKTITGWWQPDPKMALAFANITVGGYYYAIGYDVGASTFFVSITESASSGRFWNATSVYLDANVPHHFGVVVTTTPTTAPVVYIDGIAQTMTNVTTSYGTPNSADTFSIGGGQFQQFAIFSSGLTGTQIKDIYTLGLSKIRENSKDRFVRVTQYTPFTFISVPSTTYTAELLQIGAGGPPVTQELQTIADSEGGAIYVNKAGGLVFTSRTALFEGYSLNPYTTFGGAGVSIGTEISYRMDADNIRNDLAVGYSGDGTVQVTDATSVAAYGTAGGSWQTQLSTIDQAQALGNFLVGFSKDPKIVIEPFDVNVSATTSDWDDVLNLELLERTTVNIVPRTGSTITQSVLIQGIEHTFNPNQWSSRLTVSARFTNPFIIGSSLIGGTDIVV